MQEDDEVVDALLEAFRVDAEGGLRPGVWENALDTAFTAEPSAELAGLVPVIDDEAVIPGEDEIVMSDESGDAPDTADAAADHAGDGAAGPGDGVELGDEFLGDDPAAVDPGADSGVDLGESDDDSVGDGW